MGGGAARRGQVVYASMRKPSIPATSTDAAGFFDARAEVRVAFLGRLHGLSTAPSTADAARHAFELRCASAEASPVVNRQVHSDRIVDVYHRKPAGGEPAGDEPPLKPFT